jgi:hypothetical protein
MYIAVKYHLKNNLQTSQTPRILEFNNDAETEFHLNGANRRALNGNAQVQPTTSPVDVDAVIGGSDWHSLASEETVLNTAQGNGEWPARNNDVNDVWASARPDESQSNWETVLTDQNQKYESETNDEFQSAHVGNDGETEIYQSGQNTNWESAPSEANQAWDDENAGHTAADENFVGIGDQFETVNTDDEGSAWGSQENFGEGWGESVDWGTAENGASPDNQV